MKFLSFIAFVWYLFGTARVTAVSCPDSDYQCIQSQVCIPKSKTCDSIQDCSDGSDESLNAGCESPTSIPSNLHIKNITSSSITVEWNAINDMPEDRITSYQCQIVTTNGGFLDIKTVSQSNGLVSITFVDLLPGYLYKFRVRAINLSGPGQYSGFITATTSSGILGAVTNIQVTPVLFFENTSVLLQWNPPTLLLGYTTKSLTYYLSYCELNVITGCTNISLNSSTLQIKLMNLKSNIFYQYTITPIAVYTVGVKVGEASSNIFKTALTALPKSAPVIQQIASAGPNSIVIVFSVINDLSERVQSYSFININTSIVQTVNALNLPPSVNTLNVTFTGLSTGVYYFFKGKAVNPSGDGPYSSPLGFMLPASGLVVTAFNVTVAPVTHFESNSVKISWSPPQTTGAADPSAFQYLTLVKLVTSLVFQTVSAS
ncbi:netrin receptor DCC-like isoform X1 [Hydra vulgaris]|uniref:netrin receptor DCC-like isoform X1 n=1 Tax=Hydra vulgaris TaxID=6087 RepID=UPI0032EA180F